MPTIFAPITSISKSAVIVIRISGPNTIECLQHLGVKSVKNREPVLAKLKKPKTNQIIDQSLITFFKAPNSFTGEDVAEISIHGSPYILQEITNILLEIKDVALAEAGEFSKRAFLNGKMDLVEAEAIVDLIESETSAQHKQAMRQMQGELGRIYENWRAQLIKISANIEAFIDFPDEDLPEDIIDEIESKVANLISQIKEHLNDNKRGEKIRQGLNLAIIGAPNVGKSSLINYLAKSEVAIVSEIAGTTRDIVNVHLNIAGCAVVISDTAGIRQTEDLIEREGVKRALKKAKMADIKIIICDVNNIENFDESLVDENSIVVINKIDLENCALKKIKNLKIKNLQLLISIKENINLDCLIEKLEEKVKNLVSQNSSPPITRARYRYALKEAVENLSEFSLRKNIEFAAEDLRLAARAIGKITCKIEVDDILDVIFSGFCVGK
jgi:tRNA modification GTPase